METTRTWAWESLDEYRDTQKFARHLGRIFASLPRRERWFLRWPLTRATKALACSITGLNLDGVAPENRVHCEKFRDVGLRAIALLRQELGRLRENRLGSQWDLGVGLGLLDRIERKLLPASSTVRGRS